MASIPQIDVHFSTEGLSTEQFAQITADYTDAFMRLYAVCVREGIWRDGIERVVFTDLYTDDLWAQAREWDVQPTLSAHKEYVGVAKCLYNHNAAAPKWQLFVPIVFAPFQPEWEGMVMHLLVGPASHDILPAAFHPFLTKGLLLYNIDDYVRYAVSGWCPAFQGQQQFERLVEHKLALVEEKSLFTLFARKLKKALYGYNANATDDGLNEFWNKVFAGMYNLVLRSIDIYIRKGTVQFADPVFNQIVLDLLGELNTLTAAFQSKGTYDLQPIRQVMVQFLAYFQVEISDTERDDQFRIHLTKNPKDYFKNLLVDTEPRMVCFMDILGFSQMIEEYETDNLSTVLQDIQEAFKRALAILSAQADNQQAQEFLQYLEYKTFSDNICISLPYFDNETDFLANLNLMIVFLRGLQYSLMTLGFFTRGGLTIGSYYSDENMIFSKALVDAYRMESKLAKYPRILIADNIIQKLLAFDANAVRFYQLEHAIIKDRDYHFVNPFLLLSDTSQMISSLFNPALYGEDDNELTNFFKTMTSTLGELLQDQMKAAMPPDDAQLNTILGIIHREKQRFKDDRKTLAKYVWIELVSKWTKGETVTKRFKYFSMDATK
ncbi:MAG: hypothetical protein HYU70_00620 [Bacteroidetes bacterium]|nr:hypothetical protein [Bacteroidota bacterium]